MARRRPSCRRRSSSGRTKAKASSGRRNDGASFKPKGQADFTSSKHTAMENGSARERKENCDPLGPPSCDPQGKKPLGNNNAPPSSPSSPLHRPNHLNNLINVNSGRDSACSDETPISSCSLYTSSSSTPSCDTPSLSSYDNSRTGTPSIQTPSMRTPSIRTPSLFGSSFDNSSFDASSLEYESNSSSVCGTPVTPRPGHPHPNAHPLELSSSQEESSEESRARKRTEKRKRYRRNRRLRMLAAMHMENVEREKLCKMASSSAGDKVDEAIATGGGAVGEMAIDVPVGNVVEGTQNGVEKESAFIEELTLPPAVTTLKERDSVEEVVDEGFSENFDKAQRKNLEETIVTTNMSAATKTVKDGDTYNRELSVDVIRIEVEGEVRFHGGEEGSKESENAKDIMNKYADGLSQTLKDEMDKITSEVLESRVSSEKSNEVTEEGCADEEGKVTEEEEKGCADEEGKVTEEEEKGCADEEGGSCEDDDGREEGTDDDPPKEKQSEEPSGSSSETGEESTSPDQVDGTSTSPAAENKETEKEPLPSGKQVNEEIDTVVCTKAVPDEVTSAVVNDNLHLINRFDKLELVDVIETQGCPENLVVLEMKNNADGLTGDSAGQEEEEEEQKITDNENGVEAPKGKVRFAGEEENENVEQVVDIPIIMESGYEEIFPEERVEVIDVMKAGEGEDGDIVIFEVQNDDEAKEEEEEEEGEEEEEEDGGVEETDNDTKEDAENEPNDEVAVAVGKEATDSSSTSEPGRKEEEVEIAQNGVISTDVDKNAVVGPTTVGDEAKKPAGKVDAALAELDSIPDGVCESGEVEEEEEDEEEWSYYRMEPQTHPQGEDVITSGGAPAAVSSKPAEDIEIISEPTDIVLDQVIVPAEEPKAKTEDLVADLIEESTDLTEQPEKNELVENIDEIPVTVGKTPDNLESKMDMDLIPSLDDHPERLINFSGPGLEKTDLIDTGLEQNSPHGSGSPRAPGSPRSVEGFVTSVELNTADESFATNFAVNQAQDGFAGPVMDQSSGPFSVYVSSSPEPTSLDPPTQSVDLLNMTSGLTNGQVDDEHPMNRAEVRDESPVEIVHAQSTVEVVAPPSPVDVSGPETLFTMPDQQVPDSPASVHMPPTDISFVPQPIIEPSAEVPVPVYVDDTPVSEPEIIPDVTQAVSATEDFVTVSKTEMEVEAENITETLVSNVESFVETTRTEVTEANYSMETETSNHMVTDFEAKEELLQLSSPVPPLYSDEKDVISVKSPDFETIPNTGEAFVEERTSPVTTEAVSVSDVAEKDSQIASPEPVKVKTPEPVEAKSPEPVKAKSPEPVEAKSPEPVEAKSPEPLEVKSPEPVEAKSPELIAKSPEAVKSPEPEAVKSPEPAVAKATKAAKTPAKSAGDKAATKATPGKATPSKSTPAKATPKSTTPSSTRTPSTRTPTTRTPLAKSTEKKTPTSKPASPAVASRTAAPRPASTRPASAPTSAKPTVSRTAAPKPATTKPAPAKPSTTRSSVTAPKPTTKAAGTTVPKAGSTTKPTTTRPTSASTTTTKKPLDATKSADKADGKLVNGTARPSSRPGTARPTSTTTAARKPLTSTTKTATKSAAEKETKNTTNQILSTRPSKTASSTTKTAASRTTSATHSTSRTTSKVSESANATKSRVTTTTKTTASKTTGAATKKTMVTKSKTSQAGTKETSVKTKTEAAVIAKAEPLVNGENKIADEETSVEVLEKCAVEDIMQASSEKIIAETMSSEQMVVTTETTEVLVNGDH
ncbi:serine-rich adhesin for platelets-like isoform X2 [Macrobrachium rosenbergii]|uniref:serine-rich adhesin for platelets-like isoform X2 n=1 Tax=Macrobrachium rosenbergii TaxID=79674 RepID=UPI0034D6EAEC